MSYSLDIRERVVDYVRSGGLRSEASRLFGVDRKTICNWLHRDDLSPSVHGPRRRKLDKTALLAHVRDFPDALLRERAAHFGVHINAIWFALKHLGVTKKGDALQAEKSQ